MKRLSILAGLASTLALAGCSNIEPVTPVESVVSTVVPVATQSGHYGHTVKWVATPTYNHAPAHHVVTTGGLNTAPLAVHANVPTPFGASNAMTYNGYNGVRPFLVQSGAVWNGPSTYMLPVGSQVGTHQHVRETVSSDYVSSTVVESAPVVQDHGHRHAVSTAKLSIRKQPNRNAETCAIIPANGRTDVFECNAGWCRVSYKGTPGYARQTYLRFVE